MRHPFRAPEYRALAATALQAAGASSLPHVQAKHEQAARTWSELADAEDARMAARAQTPPSGV
ncbi:hypothetical protein V7S57_15035 [Caulobacter sp. CCNWLY153]|uniref:Uncharacterized protein n=1 Tax=Caulobacter radicis TaxID=2172650 RepID=A0A2T9IY53_9CAUL|nr:hypothetical protein [Caulobacter radicis]PVM72021.1 hypothetical protein DDF65_23310 [Caulobacter radicis]